MTKGGMGCWEREEEVRLRCDGDIENVPASVSKSSSSSWSSSRSSSAMLCFLLAGALGARPLAKLPNRLGIRLPIGL